MSNRLIKINSITDYHLRDFMDSPQRFWKKHCLKHEQDAWDWRDLVEYTVNQTVREFFSLPPSSRSTTSILESISRHWRKEVHLFRNREHYFNVLGMMTSQLMEYLVSVRHITYPIYTNQKLSVKVPALDLSLSMTIPLAMKKDQNFSIINFVTKDNLELRRSWMLFAIFFSYQAFHIIPTELKIVNVLSGTIITEHPSLIDLTNAEHYVALLKETLRDPAMYSHHPLHLIH